MAVVRSARPRNDPGRYDDLVDRWWEPRGPFAMLHWPAGRPGAVLVDLGCGAGLQAPHGRRDTVAMVPVPSTALLFQGIGRRGEQDG